MGIETVKFRGRHNSGRAIAALAAGILSAALLIAMPVIRAVSGESGAWMGVAGIAAAAVSCIGLAVSVKAAGERDIYVALPITGMVINGITLLAYLIIYVIGLA